MSAATEIVQALTRDQVRVALHAFVAPVLQFDSDGDMPKFLQGIRDAAKLTERMADEVPA